MMSNLITLKHLCREFDVDPYPLRQKLRKGLEHKRNQRWQWPDDDPQLAEAREIAKQLSIQTMERADAKTSKPK